MTRTGGPGGKGRLVYVTYQTIREGQAGHTHAVNVVRGLEALGWEVRFIHPGQGRFAPAKFIAIPVRAAGWLLAGKGDAVYLRGHFLALPVSVLARILQRPVFHEINGLVDEVRQTHPGFAFAIPLFARLLRLQLKSAAAVFPVTENLRRHVVDAFGATPGRVTVVGNGVDANLFRPSVRPEIQAKYGVSGFPYGFFEGALAPWQGLRTLVDAFAVFRQAAPENPDTPSLVIAGSGQEGAYLSKCAGQYRWLKWLGHVPQADLPPLISAARYCFCPMEASPRNRITGLSPIKLYEYMACAAPVIATDIPGQSDEVLAAECGVVVPPGDVFALSAAIRALHDRPETARRLGENGRRAVLERHTWRHRAEQLDEVMSKALSGRTGGAGRHEP